MKHNLYLPKGFKRIGLNTKFGSLEHSRLNGYVFSIRDSQHQLCGSAKKYLYLTGPSELKWEIVKDIFPVGIVSILTEGELYGFDSGTPHTMKTCVYVIKKNIVTNNQNGNQLLPTIMVDDTIEKYSNHIKIKGPCTIIYDNDKYHNVGGKVWVETNSEIEYLE